MNLNLSQLSSAELIQDAKRDFGKNNKKCIILILYYLAGRLYCAPKKQRYTPILGRVTRSDCFAGLIWKDYADDMICIDNMIPH